MAYVKHRFRIVAINVFLSFNFAVVFNFNVFPFLLNKAQFLGNVPSTQLGSGTPTPSPKSECVPPKPKGGGYTHLRVRGGGSPNS